MGEISLKIGDKAPDFTLKNQYEKDITLSSFFEIGRKVLLSFHPLAWTPVCEIQMRTLELKHAALADLETTAVGISVDSVFSKKAWAKAIDIEKTDILADFWPHGEVAKQYGQFIGDKGISGRANILINDKGVVEVVKVYRILEIPDIEEIIRLIEKSRVV